MMPPVVQLSGEAVEMLQSVIAQAEVRGADSLPHATWLEVCKKVYLEYIESLAGPGGTSEETQEIKQQEAKTWAERFPEFLPATGTLPSEPRAKAIVFKHGGKVIHLQDVSDVEGYAPLGEQAAAVFIETMVRHGWARVQSRSNYAVTAWSIRPEQGLS
jgi:hypothetical protein